MLIDDSLKPLANNLLSILRATEPANMSNAEKAAWPKQVEERVHVLFNNINLSANALESLCTRNPLLRDVVTKNLTAKITPL